VRSTVTRSARRTLRIVATFSKIHPFLSELRTATGQADFCKHMEAIVLAAPDAEATLARLAEGIRAAAKARRSSPLSSTA
jgi:hypothetical protein